MSDKQLPVSRKKSSSVIKFIFREETKEASSPKKILEVGQRTPTNRVKNHTRAKSEGKSRLISSSPPNPSFARKASFNDRVITILNKTEEKKSPESKRKGIITRRTRSQPLYNDTTNPSEPLQNSSVIKRRSTKKRSSSVSISRLEKIKGKVHLMGTSDRFEEDDSASQTSLKSNKSDILAHHQRNRSLVEESTKKRAFTLFEFSDTRSETSNHRKNTISSRRRETLTASEPNSPSKNFTIYLPNSEKKAFPLKRDKTLKYYLKKLRNEKSDLTIDKYVPKDIDGNALDINLTLSEIAQSEISFGGNIQATEMKARLITIWLPRRQRSMMYFKPDMVLKDLLQKLCETRPNDLTMDKYTPKDMNGNPLDINKTLGEINEFEIVFGGEEELNTGESNYDGSSSSQEEKSADIASFVPGKRDCPKVLTVSLPSGHKHTLLWAPDLVLKEALEKICSNKTLRTILETHLPQSPNGIEIPLHYTLSQIDQRLFTKHVIFGKRVEEAPPSDFQKQFVAQLFVVYLPRDQKHTIFFEPKLILRDVLRRIVATRPNDVTMTSVPRDLQGRVLDFNLTLGQLGVNQILFGVNRDELSNQENQLSPHLTRPKMAVTPSTEQVLKLLTIFLPRGEWKTMIFNPESVLRDVLQKICDSRPDMSLDLFKPTDSSGVPLNLDATLGQLHTTKIIFGGELDTNNLNEKYIRDSTQWISNVQDLLERGTVDSVIRSFPGDSSDGSVSDTNKTPPSSSSHVRTNRKNFFDKFTDLKLKIKDPPPFEKMSSRSADAASSYRSLPPSSRSDPPTSRSEPPLSKIFPTNKHLSVDKSIPSFLHSLYEPDNILLKFLKHEETSEDQYQGNERSNRLRFSLQEYQSMTDTEIYRFFSGKESEFCDCLDESSPFRYIRATTEDIVGQKLSKYF